MSNEGPPLHEVPIVTSNLDLHVQGSEELGYPRGIAEIIKEILSEKKTLDELPTGHISLPGHLNKISKLYQSLFQLSGNLDDLEEAISLGQQSVSLTREGDIFLPVLMHNLGTGYEIRFRHTQKVSDLSEAISCHQKAICLTSEEHPSLPSAVIEIANLYLQRFQWTNNKGDVSEAISWQRKAILLSPEQDSNIPDWLHSLGTLHTTHFECTGNLANLSEAISSIHRSVQLTAHKDPKLPRRMNDLASSYLSYFKAEGNLADLHEAISLREKAIRLIQDGHPDKSIALYNLGYMYEALFRQTGSRIDLDKAASSYTDAISTSAGIPSFKLLASKQLARISEDVYPLESIKAYTQAIQFVAQSASLHETIEMRHSNLRHISSTSTLAAAFAFKIGRTDLALQWLEQGRGLVWSQLNDLRTPIDDLHALCPDLANDITRVAAALEISGYQRVVSDSDMDDWKEDVKEEDSQTKLVQEWDELVAKIRLVPGLEQFLRPLSSSAVFERLPSSGNIVLVNLDKGRSDALALVPGASEPFHIPLPEFPYSKALALRDQLQTNLHSSGVRMRGAESIVRGMRKERSLGLKDVLRQLWYCLVKPIIEALGFSAPPAKKRRIWWCTTGPLSFLPIHAAGIYDNSSPERGSTLADFAISSYTPTIRALLERVKTDQGREVNKPQILMVSQQYTPGLPPIPKTAEEVRLVQDLAKAYNVQVRCLEGDAATIEQTTTEMETHSSVHFACHASQDADRPLQSAFALHNGQLELSSIIRKQLHGADLAFLSACQTSRGVESLSEEAVHLAAGMLAAGYRGVVATMWSIRDSYAPAFAEDFYAFLLDKSPGLEGEGAAHALHHSTQRLRRKLELDGLGLEASLLVWVPYVHFGF